MRSKAHIKSHPLHPILIAFPIAFFTGSLFFDIAGLIWSNDSFWNTAYYLNIAGIIFALIAAIPGIIDFIYVVPPKSSAKKRGAKHGITNGITVCVFIGVVFYRRGADPSPYIILGLEILGVILLSIAGWMGGTLVYRNQIGVDIRYANAGKWKQQYLKDETQPIAVAQTGELKLNQMKLLHIKDKRIVLARTEKGYAAFDDRCSHKGGSLAGGSMVCGTVQCPWHGTQFDVSTGQLKCGPGKEGIAVYAIEEKEGKVFLSFSQEK
ncbi:MAG: Rieske 2Fe-2S protein [Chitinophagaceae bacterium]|nr:Rieske 2Fe-2S protein [Chitinophagaceae bacterium]